MKILVINSGSSSIKYQLLDMTNESVVAQGLVERIGSQEAVITHQTNGGKSQKEIGQADHSVGLQWVADMLLDPEHGVVEDKEEITAVGHRVVHGGNTLTEAIAVTTRVKDKIRELQPLAPLHNPHNLTGIVFAEAIFPKAKQVAVFDTAFFQTLPSKARRYAIPNALYEKGIQVYGFHGISHSYVSKRALQYLDDLKAKLVTVHLGNGCSMTAVNAGKSVDHTMGFTPSNGLIMGTRSGDIDHGLIFYLVDTLGYSLGEVNSMLLKESGMLGLTGHADLRDIESQAGAGDAQCQLALEMNAYRIKKFLGAYAASMNGLDAVIFTAGIGENSSTMRRLVCQDMDFLGIQLDETLNNQSTKGLREIGMSTSKTKILVIPTNEELEIAKQVFTLVS